MNIHACAQNLLTYFPPEERSIPDSATYPGRNAAVEKALNDALQDLFGKGKPWVRNDERGLLVYAPAVVTIAVENGSTIGTIAEADWLAWFSGCTISITGSAVDNQIRNDERTVRLKYPHDGPTGTASATIYHDSLDLEEDVLEVHGPVRLNRQPLTPIASPYSYVRGAPTEDFAHHMSVPRPNLVIDNTAGTAGTPLAYTVETWSPSAILPPRVRIRLFPAPLESSAIDMSVMLTPPRVSEISSDDALPIPFGHVESIFLPIALKKLRGSPFWRGIVGEQEIDQGYANALSLLQEGSPSKESGVRLRTLF